MCGRPPSTGTGEHVFPRWLQHRYDLRDKSLILFNGTQIPYRRLLSPCCESCNTGPLARLEKRVKTLSEKADIHDTSLRHVIGQWLFKILVGIIHAESRFRRDRANPSLGSIFPPERVEELQALHLLVNSCRKLTLFRCLHGPLPFTLYLYKIAASQHYGQFDFSTNLIGKSIAIRMGHLGAIAVADGGLQFEFGVRGPFELDGQELHPLQFAEMTARVHYKSALRDATHMYINSETQDTLRIEQIRVLPYSNALLQDRSHRIFRDWNERNFSSILPKYTRLNTQWYDEAHDRAISFAFLPDGSRNVDFASLDDFLARETSVRSV